MYSISQTALAALRAHAKQTMTIKCTPTKGSSFEITDSDMVGAPTISYASVSGDKIEIGSAIAAELSFTLNNWDGKFDDKIFEGAELYVEEKVPSVNYTVPMGYFTVDNTPRKLTTIKITAYDRMARFDRPYDTQLSYPATLYGIIDDACTKCGVPCGVSTSALNAKNNVPNKPEADNLTYRQVIMWAAQLMGMNLYIDRGGTLMAKWYTSSSNHQYIEPSDRFMSGNTYYAENSVTVTGVRIVCNDEAKTEYIAGTTDYAFNIEGNLLAQEGMSLQTIATYIYDSRSITYRPMSCQTFSFPHLMPLDIINFRTASGDSYPTILTNVTHTLNQNSKLEGKGKTAAQAGHATLGAFTSRQQAILEQTKNQTYATISGMQQAVLKLNETMANSMGLYVTTIGDGSGGTITYYHNEPYLENSSTIYCKNAGGYAWTNTGWNSGNPIWHYGVSKDGDAVMRSIATNKLIADYITAGTINGHDGKFSINLDTGKIIASDATLNGVFRADTTYQGASSVELSALTVNSSGQYLESLAGLRFYNDNYGKSPYAEINGSYLNNKYAGSNLYLCSRFGNVTTAIHVKANYDGTSEVQIDGELRGGVNGLNIGACQAMSLYNEKTIKGYATDGTLHTLLGMSSANHVVLGANSQPGNINIRTHSGGKINFFVGGVSTPVGYIDSNGYHGKMSTT